MAKVDQPVFGLLEMENKAGMKSNHHHKKLPYIFKLSKLINGANEIHA